jgi:hypothetical protein
MEAISAGVDSVLISDSALANNPRRVAQLAKSLGQVFVNAGGCRILYSIGSYSFLHIASTRLSPIFGLPGKPRVLPT